MCYELGNQKSQVGSMPESNSILKLTLVCGSKFDIQIFKKILCPKKRVKHFWVQIFSGQIKLCVKMNYWSKKCLRTKRFGGTKIWGPIFFLYEKIQTQANFWSKIFWSTFFLPKKIGIQKHLGPKKNLAQNNVQPKERLWSKKNQIKRKIGVHKHFVSKCFGAKEILILREIFQQNSYFFFLL